MSVALNGTAVNWTADGSYSSATSPSFSTSTTNCILVVLFAAENGNTANPAVTVSSISDTTGQSLVWQRYGGKTITTTAGEFGTAVLNAEVWWTIAPSAVSAKTVTVHVNNGADNDGTSIWLFAASGENTAHPFDLNAGAPFIGFNVGTGASTAPSVAGVTTNTSTGLLVSFFASTDTQANNNIAPGWTLIGGAYDGNNAVGIESINSCINYTSAVNNATEFPVSSGQTGYNNWIGIYFAITDQAQAGGTPTPTRTMMGVGK